MKELKQPSKEQKRMYLMLFKKVELRNHTCDECGRIIIYSEDYYTLSPRTSMCIECYDKLTKEMYE